VITSGGLGPTADDLTATVVGEFCGRAMVLDAALEERIAAIVLPLRARWPHLTEETIRASNRKQAVIPEGATVIEPVGTAPALVVAPATGATGRPWSSSRARRASCSRCGSRRRRPRRSRTPPVTPPFTNSACCACSGSGVGDRNDAARGRARGVPLSEIEITTCVRGGELEIVTRFEPHAGGVYEAFERIVRERHAQTLFSDDGTGVDEQVASMLVAQGLTVAAAESCTGGLMMGRLTDRPGASAYLREASSSTPTI